MALDNNKPFNPNEHLIQIKGRGGSSDYLPVQWRLVWFRSLCPDGTIETEIVHLDLDRDTEEETYTWNSETRRSEKVIKRAPGFAVFRAIVKDGRGGMAIGTKSEKAASFPDFIEKSETGAIGRALAALGYGTQFTGDEFDEQHRIVDAPVEQHSQAAQQSHQQLRPASAQPVQEQSEAVKDMIRKAQKRAGKVGIKDMTAWDALVARVLGHACPTDKLELAGIAKINGELTRLENAEQSA